MVICIYLRVISQEATETLIHENEFENHTTVIPVCNDHLSNKIYYLWFIQ